SDLCTASRELEMRTDRLGPGGRHIAEVIEQAACRRRVGGITQYFGECTAGSNDLFVLVEQPLKIEILHPFLSETIFLVCSRRRDSFYLQQAVDLAVDRRGDRNVALRDARQEEREELIAEDAPRRSGEHQRVSSCVMNVEVRHCADVQRTGMTQA